MKKILLSIGLISANFVNAQLTQSNEPIIGNTISMYVCDSNATNLSSITGNGVTWDYSTISAYPSKFKTIEVVDPTTTSQASTFTSSTKATKIQNFITSYWTSTANDRTSQGFVFTEPSMGNVIADFSTDNETTMSYPFDLDSTVSDNFSGNLGFTLVVAQNPSSTGSGSATIDGKGTLILSSTVTKTNVLRYKISDHTHSVVTLLGNPQNVDLYRTQYEYYDASSNLPIFTHTNVTMTIPGLSININTSLVLSSVQPDGFVGLKSNSKEDFTIYPNPTKDNVTISGSFSENATAKVLDQTGRQIISSTPINNGTVINLANLTNGIYLIEIENNGLITKKSVIVQ